MWHRWTKGENSRCIDCGMPWVYPRQSSNCTFVRRFDDEGNPLYPWEERDFEREKNRTRSP